MKLAFNLIIGLLFCFELAIAQDNVREWIDDTGKYKTRAALVKVHEDEVELRLENGQLRMVPIVRLSKTDVAYLRDLALQQKKPTAPPAAKDLPEKIIRDLALQQKNPPALPAAKDQPEKIITNSIGIKLALIPKGTFEMGSPPSELGSEDDERQHEVTISQDYYLGVYEVTQGQYQQVMGENPSYFQGERVAERHPKTGRFVKEMDTSNHPVEQVLWEDAVEFCKRLSLLPEEKKAGRVYRLPTEAEWEYACRAGSKTAYSFGEGVGVGALGEPVWLGLDEHAWFGWTTAAMTAAAQKGKNSYEYGPQTHPVGEKKPNDWGLYDMHGNVWEWCSDWYGEYPKGAVTDPAGPAGDLAQLDRGGYWVPDASGQPVWKSRVYRGGSWVSHATNCRSADRILSALNSVDSAYIYSMNAKPLVGGFFSNAHGFRLVLRPSGDVPAEPEQADEAMPDGGAEKLDEANGETPPDRLPDLPNDQETADVLTNSVGIKLVLIPQGTFMMGSPKDETGRRAYSCLITRQQNLQPFAGVMCFQSFL